MEKGLPLIINNNTSVLILGSFPSKISLAQQEYYANKSNDFWKILGEVYSKDFKSINYNEKIEMLLSNGIVLWDVYSKCQRIGSMDKNINEFILNDFEELKKSYPNLERICFNGKKAGNHSEIILALGYNAFVLPSSSGANRRCQTERISNWDKVLK